MSGNASFPGASSKKPLSTGDQRADRVLRTLRAGSRLLSESVRTFVLTRAFVTAVDRGASPSPTCPECGEAVSSSRPERHECEDERWLIFQMAHSRDLLRRLEPAIRAYLDSPSGRFEAWYAERERLGRGGGPPRPPLRGAP